METLRLQSPGTGPAAALIGGRVRTKPGRGHVRRLDRDGAGRSDAAVPQRDEADLRARRLSGELHVPAAVAACRVVRLASASFDRGYRRPGTICFRTQTDCRRWRATGWADCCGMRRAAAAFSTPTINGYKRYHAELDGAGSRRMGVRQPSGDGARRRPARRSRDPAGEPGRRARGQSVSLHGLADRRGSGWYCDQRRSRTVGRYAIQRRRAARCRRH